MPVFITVAFFICAELDPPQPVPARPLPEAAEREDREEQLVDSVSRRERNQEQSSSAIFVNRHSGTTSQTEEGEEEDKEACSSKVSLC